MIRCMEIHYEKTVNIIDLSEFLTGHCYHVKGVDVDFIGICTDIHDTSVIFTPLDVPNNVFDDYYNYDKYSLDKYNPRIDSFHVDEVIIEWHYDPKEYLIKIKMEY